MEYENCIDCEQSFFNDATCVFEPDGEENDKIDYSIFVFSERNLQKELSKLMIVDSKEKPHITTKKLNNMVNMYIGLHNRNFKGEHPLQFMSEYFHPIVRIKKRIHSNHIEDENAKMRNIFDTDNVQYETIPLFIRKKKELAGYPAPFVPETENKSTIEKDLDSIYYWKLGELDKVESVRLLDTDTFCLIGLVNTLSTDVAIPYTIGNVDSYFDALHTIAKGDNVRIIPHTDIIGLIEEDAIVDAATDDKIVAKGSSGTRVTMDISTIEATMRAPFCFGIPKYSNLFNKRAFFNGNYMALFANPDLLVHLQPSIDQWIYCHPEITTNIFNLHDAAAAFGPSIKAVEHTAHSIIKSNMSRARRAHNARKPAKIITKLYRNKKWSPFLNLGKSFKHEKTSIDTAFSRMKWIDKHGAIQVQILRCIEEDIAKVPKSKDGGGRTFVDDQTEVAVRKLLAFLDNADKRVYANLDEAYNNQNEQDGAFAYVWNHETLVFIVLKRKAGSWMVDLDESTKQAKWIAGCEYDPLNFRLVVPNRIKYIHDSQVQKSLAGIEGSVPDIKAIEVNIMRNNQQYNSTYSIPDEITTVIPEEFTMLDGDDDFVDIDAEYNNHEFGHFSTWVDDVNSDQGDDEDDEGPIGANGNTIAVGPKTGVYLFVEKIAHLCGILIDDSTINMLGQNTIALTDYDHVITTLKAFEVRKLGEIAGKITDTAKLEAAKAKITVLMQPRYDELYRKIAYHITALLCIFIQISLPQVVINAFPEHSKVFGLEGYPLNEVKKGTNTLVGYIAVLMTKTISTIRELTFLGKMQHQVCQEQLTMAIGGILAQSPFFVDKLNEANKAHQNFKAQHQQVLNIINSYPLWSTFRPYIETKENQVGSGKEYTGNSVAEITSTYISLIQRIVEKTRVLKVGIDKKPMQINSCCIEAVSQQMSFWNYFLENDQVKELVQKLPSNNAKNSTYGIMRLYDTQVAPLMFLDLQIIGKSKTKDLGDSYQLDINTERITTARVISTTAKEFMHENKVFRDDPNIEALVNMPNDRSSWSKLSSVAFVTLQQVAQQSQELSSSIAAFQAILLGSKDQGLLAQTILAFLSYEMKTLFGKLGNDYKYSYSWSKNRKLIFEEKKNIEEAIKGIVPEELNEAFAISDFGTLQEAMNYACANGLNNISSFDACIKTNKNATEVAYLLTYIMSKCLLVVYEWDEYEDHAVEVFTRVVKILFDQLISKHNTNISITRAAELYEQTREGGKQSIIAMMKAMSGEERSLIKDMKKRGLVNLLNMAKGNSVQNQNGDNRQTNIIGTGTEGDVEVISNLVRNQGENADNDDEYDDYY